MIISRSVKAFVKSTTFIKDGIKAKTPKIVYIGGWIGWQNLGDEVLYAAMKTIFNKHLFFRYDGCKPVSILSKFLPFMEYGVFGGGTLINRNESFFQEHLNFLKLCSQIFVFGTGVANPSFWNGRQSWVNLIDKWKPLLEKALFVGVRGPLSADLLKDIGINNVEIVGDPVLVFAENEINNSFIPKTIGLNIGTSNGNIWGNEDKVCAEYIKLASIARKSGWEVKWFVVWSQDLPITKKAASLSETSDNIYEIYNDHNKYIELVRPLSTFVGMKLHATILATCAIVPSIMLEYRPKCRDYMRSIGQDTSTIRTDKFDAENVWEIVRYWDSQRDKFANILFNGIKPLQQYQRQKANELINKLGLV